MLRSFEDAFELRRAGRHEESRALLNKLLIDPMHAQRAHLHIAWSYDNEGLEAQAVPHYEQALEGKLQNDERLDALFGLASTLRSLGRYHEALKRFDEAVAENPESVELVPFRAMCLYNLGRNKEAVSSLLRLLVANSEHPGIKAYSQAIELYANDLDRVWE